MELNLFIILGCGFLAVFLIFKEFKRKDKSRLIVRLLANILMMACFALLIIPIYYSIKRNEPADVLNLVTNGTDLDTLNNIKAVKYDLDSTLFPIKKNQKITHIADLAYFLEEHSTFKKINIYGYGLSESELEKLKDKQVSFHPSVLPSGVISASWQKKLQLTESLKIQGIYYNGTDKTVQLKLFGMGTSLDSAMIKPHTQFKFSFANSPKQIGKAVFNLIALQGNDTLSVEPVPIEVTKKQSITVLILASFPDFEYKFLKKWLYENQYAVALRSQVSKNKYSTDFLNREAVNLNQLNQALLKNMDLVIIDDEEFAAISAGDRASLFTAVANGMGLIIKATNLKSPIGNLNINQYEIPSTVEKPLSLKSTEINFSDLSFKQTLYLKPNVNAQPLITDQTGKILVSSKLNGMGKILTTTFSSTFQWQLAGKQSDYSNFWSLLFAKSLRKKLENESVNLLPQFPSINEKARLMMSLADNKIPNIVIDSVKIHPRQNMEIPSEWDGFYWVKSFGWHQLFINQKAENIYFYKNSDWNNAKNYIKLNNNVDFVANQTQKLTTNNEVLLLTKEAVSKWWFLLGFLLSISFLWVEQRFLAKN